MDEQTRPTEQVLKDRRIEEDILRTVDRVSEVHATGKLRGIAVTLVTDDGNIACFYSFHDGLMPTMLMGADIQKHHLFQMAIGGTKPL